jgi:hypothetical protein
VIWSTLAFRHLWVRPGRAAVLLLGYGLGVAVMIVLLSVGDAMLDQSRDVRLVGGGELTALPEGVDVEAMRTGGLAGMFAGINGARFVTRELLGGPRHAGMVRAVSPVLEQKLLHIRVRDTVFAVRAGGELPAASGAVGAALPVLAGRWRDNASDSVWANPSPQQLYDQIDHFHVPAIHDSTWAEWHYFNVVMSEREWWYLTFLVAGDVGGERWAGRLLVTHRLPDGEYHRYVTSIPRDQVRFDTVHADVALGGSSVMQRNGTYHIHGVAGQARFDLTFTPLSHVYFPPVELGTDHAVSGYAVPALAAAATGQVCDDQRCNQIRGVAGYHDHNWGVWHDVTWEWGTGRGRGHYLLYGGVIPADSNRRPSSMFLALEDSLGVEQIYRFDQVEAAGARARPGQLGLRAPDSLTILAARSGDTLHLNIGVADASAAPSRTAANRIFVQLRGTWRLAGRAAGARVTDSGHGFFETWLRARPRQ